MKYFILPNLSSHETQIIETQNLFEIQKTTVPKEIENKEQFTAWAKNPLTKGCFYSVMQGQVPTLRTSKENKCVKIYGFIADYDSQTNDAERASISKRCNPNAIPSYVHRTFSDRARSIWFFEDPVPFFSKKFWEKFSKKLVRELKVKQLLPGFDDSSLNESQYFALGDSWQQVEGGKPISKEIVSHWVEQVSNQISWRDGETVIPIEVLRDEVEDRFPGKWKGNFEIGARGMRFWDEMADNTTAAIVRDTGMQCFTGEQPFVTWGQIFGREFVEKFIADRIGSAISDTWYDGGDYWRQSMDGTWYPATKQDLALHLRIDKRLEGAKQKGEIASEVDRAIHAIQETKRVDGALPFVGRPSGVITRNGKRFLNTSRIRPVEPISSSGVSSLTQEQIEEGCKFILGFFRDLFGPIQLPYMLAHTQRAYRSMRDGAPLPGQIVFIAGDVGIGKTFSTNVILSKLMGGSEDASSFLMGDTQFNKELWEVFCLTIDDSTPASDPKRHLLYSAAIKRLAANRSMKYNAKFRDTYDLPWSGRVYVTCNSDPESMRVLPDTDQSLLDKIMLFLVSKYSKTFPAGVEALVERELPYFARYLLDYIVPSDVVGGERYGVKCYHHPELVDTARKSTQSHSFLELLRLFLRTYFANCEGDWKGSSTELLQEMMADQSLTELAKQYRPVSVGRALGQLMNQGLPIKQSYEGHGFDKTRAWILSREIVKITG